MMRQIERIFLLANLFSFAMCIQWPFSATQNLTIEPYKPYKFSDDAGMAIFDVEVFLTNASFFYLGPALLRTYANGAYKNFTIPMPGVVYDGPEFTNKKFEFKKAVDPCIMLTHTNIDVDFTEARTNAQEGFFRANAPGIPLSQIRVDNNWGRGWRGECNEYLTGCISYYIWHREYNRYSALRLNVESNTTLSEVLQRISFRQFGSRSCPQNGNVTTKDDYSFTIDFSTTYDTKRNVLLIDIPTNVTFIVSVVTKVKDMDRFPDCVLRRTNRAPYDYPESILHPLIEYWEYSLSGLLSLLWLLVSSIVIVALKCRKRQALRAEYENIPDAEVEDNQQRDGEEQNEVLTSN